MEYSLTAATWFWLMVPMTSVVILSLVSLLVNLARK
jgi:hypothetical protein